VAQSTPSADVVLTQARAKAAKENKNVMVIFHASWCVWCHKMDSSLNDPSVKDFFDKNYIITHLTVDESKDKKKLENPGAEELKNSWGAKNSGIPFWVIMDKDGKILANSNDESGDNVGCPAKNKEVQYFIQVLKKTSSINSEQAAAVVKRFGKNE
jgi:thiol-disulfide isomerase/thioredoxin